MLPKEEKKTRACPAKFSTADELALSGVPTASQQATIFAGPASDHGAPQTEFRGVSLDSCDVWALPGKRQQLAGKRAPAVELKGRHGLSVRRARRGGGGRAVPPRPLPLRPGEGARALHRLVRRTRPRRHDAGDSRRRLHPYRRGVQPPGLLEQPAPPADGGATSALRAVLHAC